MADVAVLFVHGTSRAVLVRAMNYVVERSIKALGNIDYRSVNYAVGLENASRPPPDASLQILRSLPMNDLAVAMRYFSDRAHRVAAHEAVAQALSELAASTSATTLVLMAHSLGTIVTTDFLRSLADGSVYPEAAAALSRGAVLLLGRLQLLYTLGCPASWFFGFGESAPVAAQRKDAGSRVPLGDFAWVNLFYRSDVLVGPISRLAPAFSHVIDVSVPLGLDPLKHTPASHGYYLFDPWVFAYISADLQALRTGAAAVRGGVLSSSPAEAGATVDRSASVNCLLQLSGSRCDLNATPTSEMLDARRLAEGAVAHTLRIGADEAAPSVAVLFLHGMVTEDGARREADVVRRRVASVAKRLGSTVLLQTVNYAALASPQTEHAWDATVEPYGLTWVWLRRFVQHRCAVAMMFMTQGWYRRAVMALVDRSLQRLGAAAGGKPLPLIVVGYSTGAVVATTYLGNLQRQHPLCVPSSPHGGEADGREMDGASSAEDEVEEDAPRVAAVRQVRELRALFTLGSPLSWFLDTSSLRLPTPPSWLNVYYGWDAAAGAAKPMSEGLDRAVSEDVKLNNGWNLLAAVASGLTGKYLRDASVWDLIGSAVAAAAGKEWRPARPRRGRQALLLLFALSLLVWLRRRLPILRRLGR